MKRLLVIVDFQVDFVEGSLGFDQAKELDQKIVALMDLASKRGDDIVYTMDTHFDNYLETNEGKQLPVEHCIKGTPGWELFGETGKRLENYPSFEKYTFGSVELGEYLIENKYDVIQFAGLVTNICVLSNAIIAQAAQPQAQIIIDATTVGSGDANLHEKALDVMEGLLMTVTGRTTK